MKKFAFVTVLIFISIVASASTPNNYVRNVESGKILVFHYAPDTTHQDWVQYYNSVTGADLEFQGDGACPPDFITTIPCIYVKTQYGYIRAYEVELKDHTVGVFYIPDEMSITVPKMPEAGVHIIKEFKDV